MNWKQIVFWILITNLTLAGCVSTRTSKKLVDGPIVPEGGERAQEIRDRDRQCSSIFAEMKFRIKLEKSEAVHFVGRIWATKDNRIRLALSRLDVDFIDALIEPDGKFLVLIPSSKQYVRASILDIFAIGKGNPVLLINELKTGPLPLIKDFRLASASELGGYDPAIGGPFTVSLNNEGHVSEKSWFLDQGQRFCSVIYSGYKNLDGYVRPTKAILAAVGYGHQFTFGLTFFNALPEISVGKMTLVVPAEWREVATADFLKILEGSSQSP